MKRNVVFLVVAMIATIGVPLFIARNFQFGSFADSPQTVKLWLGQSALIAGGKAKLWFIGGESGGDFEVSSKGDSSFFRPGPDETFNAFGVDVQFKSVDDGNGKRPPRATFIVSWKD